MNCQRFADVVSELARGQVMEVDVRTDALRHSEACEECAARLANEQALSRALHTLSVQLQTRQAPDGLEFELRRAFRERHAASAPVVVGNSNRRYWLAVAAAVLLLVGSVAVMRLRSTQPTPRENQIATDDRDASPKKSPSPATVDVASSSDHEPERVAQNKPRRRHVAAASRNSQNRRADAVATNHVREVATEFIPLSYSSGVSFQDGGQIVRVELPRSALVNFGLPVNMDRLNEKVKADVWLGVDGLAHAIRFVQ
jgi:hypothetical protein